MFYFTEYPRIANSCPANHNASTSYSMRQAAAFPHRLHRHYQSGIFIRGLRFTSRIRVQSAAPLCICARVRPWMLGLNAHVLQALGCSLHFGIVISQTGFYCYGKMCGPQPPWSYGPFVDILEQTGAGAATGPFSPDSRN